MQNISEIQNNKINEIMDSFNFNATWQVLNLFGVEWTLPNGKNGRPDETLLRVSVRSGLNDICKKPVPEESKENWSLSSNRGPYHIRRFGGEKNGQTWEELAVAFIAESYQTKTLNPESITTEDLS